MLDLSASDVDAAYQGMKVRLTSGPGAGEERLVLEYIGAQRRAVVAPWTVMPREGVSSYRYSSTAAPAPFDNLYLLLGASYMSLIPLASTAYYRRAPRGGPPSVTRSRTCPRGGSAQRSPFLHSTKECTGGQHRASPRV